MSWIHDRRIVGRAIDLWRRHHRGQPKLSTVRWFASVGDVPEPLPRRVVAAAGNPTSWLIFQCPCGTGHRIMVRLIAHDRAPHWRLLDDVQPTLHPSIDSVDGEKRCHFWVRGGRVRWV